MNFGGWLHRYRFWHIKKMWSCSATRAAYCTHLHKLLIAEAFPPSQYLHSATNSVCFIISLHALIPTLPYLLTSAITSRRRFYVSSFAPLYLFEKLYLSPKLMKQNSDLF